MKKKLQCILLCLVLMVINVFMQSYIMFADEIEDKISYELYNSLKEMDKDDKQLVYIWYKDIDHFNLEEQIKNKIGYNKESILSITETGRALHVDIEHLDSGNLNNVKDYLSNSKEFREKISDEVSEYIKTERSLSSDMYLQKVNQVMEDLKSIFSKDCIQFRSQYAPMFIAELTSEEINAVTKFSCVESVDVVQENEEVPDPIMNIDPSDDGWNSLQNMKSINGFTALYNNTGLTGKNTVIGVLEQGSVGAHVELPSSRFIVISHPSSVEKQDHPINTCRILAGTNGIAPAAKVYSFATNSTAYANTTIGFYNGVEQLISKGVSVINSSFNIGGRQGQSYTSQEKWIDHIALEHNVTYVQSAGNDAQNSDNGILTLGLAYNVITVGALNDNRTATISDDSLYYYSSYNHMDGCMKPDFIAPATVLSGGTSASAPVVTGTIALMLELDPSLAIKPEAIKAILIASCHRKVKDPVTNSQIEFMNNGLTNKQGAGVMDAQKAIYIVANKQYAVGKMDSNIENILIGQPSYGGSNMNVALTWLRENEVDCSLGDFNSIVNIMPDLDLQVNNGGNKYNITNQNNSSVEMEYFPLSSNNIYELQISKKQASTNDTTYAYAWSTNNCEKYYKLANMDETGIYFIKNCSSKKYLTGMTGGVNQYSANNSKNQQWVIRRDLQATYNYILQNSYNDSINTLIRGSVLNSSNTTAILSGTDNTYQLRITNVGDDKYKIRCKNPSTNKFEELSTYNNSMSNGAKICWSTDLTNNNIFWKLEKMNYLLGDVNLDGKINQNDSNKILNYALAIETVNDARIQYLADVTGDNVINLDDVQSLTSFIGN